MVRVMCRDDVYPVRMSKVGCHCTMSQSSPKWTMTYCSGNRPWTSSRDIYHPDQRHAPVAANTVLVLLMMDAESVRNM
jgi:hypothetical protein